jgi:hypothetical protein
MFPFTRVEQNAFFQLVFAAISSRRRTDFLRSTTSKRVTWTRHTTLHTSAQSLSTPRRRGRRCWKRLGAERGSGQNEVRIPVSWRVSILVSWRISILTSWHISILVSWCISSPVTWQISILVNWCISIKYSWLISIKISLHVSSSVNWLQFQF